MRCINTPSRKKKIGKEDDGRTDPSPIRVTIEMIAMYKSFVQNVDITRTYKYNMYPHKKVSVGIKFANSSRFLSLVLNPFFFLYNAILHS